MKTTLVLSGAILLACGTTFVNAFNPKAEVKATIVYDNTSDLEGVEADWGFSCLVEGTERTILFDAGTKPEIFARNIDALEMDLNKVDSVVISHEHGDHTGGLPRLFKVKANLPVYHPVSFSQEFRDSVTKSGANVVPVDGPISICKDVYLTGEMGDAIKEQSLILRTAEGLVVITGCSHPGIVEILERTKEILDEDIYMVFGGFHLRQKSAVAMDEIIKQFRELGVKKCGATHCTGDKQIEQFQKAYGEDFVSMGVGKVLRFGKSL